MKNRFVSIVMMLSLSAVFFFNQTNLVSAANTPVFYPFRSNIVSYLSCHASENSKTVCKLWEKLFFEETHYNSNQSYYDKGCASWSNKYYSDYFVYGGGVSSSKGKQMTYAPEFTGYFIQTLRHNPDFLEELLKDNEHGMNEIVDNYLKKAPQSMPDLEDYVLELTADGTMIGKNIQDSANLMRKYGVDYQVLNIFCHRFSELNKLQQDWCYSYINEIYQDYVRHHDDGKSLAKTTKLNRVVSGKTVEYLPLYDLMARSKIGAKSDKYQQEFFDYVVGNPADVYNLPKGLGEWLKMAFDITDARIEKIETIYDIFSDEVHCIPGCSKCGSKASYENALACNIVYENSGKYSVMRNLVENNELAFQAMNEWKNHYEYVHTDKASLTQTYQVGWSDRKSESHGWHGQGYTVSASSHVEGTIDLSDKLTSNTTEIQIEVQGGSFTVVLYAENGQELMRTSGNGNDSIHSDHDIMYLNVSNLTLEQMKNATLQITVDSHDKTKVDNETNHGALAVSNVFSVTFIRKIADCYSTTPAHHQYSTNYIWNSDYSSCVAHSVCIKDRAHTQIAYSKNVIHTQDASYDYYEPVFDSKTGILGKKKAVAKNSSAQTSATININDKTKVSGTIYAKDVSDGATYHGQGVTQSSSVTASFSILAGAIPQTADSITLHVRCGNIAWALYLDGEPVYQQNVGDRDKEMDRDIKIDLSKYSSSQISRMYLNATMQSHDKTTWAYGLGETYYSSSEAILKSISVAY